MERFTLPLGIFELCALSGMESKIPIEKENEINLTRIIEPILKIKKKIYLLLKIQRLTFSK